MFENLTTNNVLLYAVKCYDKPNCIMEEFNEDYKRIRYVKRLLQRYRKTGEIKERLVLNHLIILQNVFGVEAAVRLLFFSLSEKDYPALKAFLLFTSTLPNTIRGINGKDIQSSSFTIDTNITLLLRTLTFTATQ